MPSPVAQRWCRSRARREVSFRTGGLITGVIGILMQPWKLLADPSAYIFTWLNGYSGGLGSIAGVLIADYWLVRQKDLALGDLYRERGDCEHAVTAYQTALAASRSAEITQYATFHRAACLVTMGDSSGTAALTEYLHTWPKGRFSREAARLLQGTSTANKSP